MDRNRMLNPHPDERTPTTLHVIIAAAVAIAVSLFVALQVDPGDEGPMWCTPRTPSSCAPQPSLGR